MGTAEIKVFFITICIVIAALIIGIITYVIQYRQRRLLDIAEKETIIPAFGRAPSGIPGPRSIGFLGACRAHLSDFCPRR